MNNLTRRNFGPNADPTLVSAIARRMMSADPDVVLAILAAKFGHERDLLDGLDRINAPVFAINPDFKPTDAASLARHGVELRVIEGVGHYTMMEGAVEFNRVLTDILEGLLPTE